MGLDPISAIADLINTGLSKWLPDANMREKAAAELAASVHTELMGQLEINKAEASSADPFTSRWRPFIGWSCGFAFVYSSMVVPLLTWVSINFHIAPPPAIDTSVMVNVLGAMLGIATLRTVDKYTGTSK